MITKKRVPGSENNYVASEIINFSNIIRNAHKGIPDNIANDFKA